MVFKVKKHRKVVILHSEMLHASAVNKYSVGSEAAVVMRDERVCVGAGAHQRRRLGPRAPHNPASVGPLSYHSIDVSQSFL